MCTAITYRTKDFYMGRTLDFDFAYPCEVTVMPRHFPLTLCHGGELQEHFAIIGMAHTAEGYPLYFDAVNEKGLGIAGLNFVGNAAYAASGEDKPNIAQYELIPWLLGTCTTVKEACEALTSVHLTGTPFNENYPTASLHWLLADKNKAVVIEHTTDGLHIYENPVGVMTNNPPFPQQMANLARYRGLSPHQPQGDFAAAMGLPEYSRGLGTQGLPGGLSSDARFVRVAFTRNNAISGDSEEESVGGFFHILGTVDQVRGCCEVTPGNFEITIYSSCWNADRGIYYYTTYENPQITAVDMHRTDLDGSELTGYPLLPIEIHKQN